MFRSSTRLLIKSVLKNSNFFRIYNLVLFYASSLVPQDFVRIASFDLLYQICFKLTSFSNNFNIEALNLCVLK